jgi:hypothetical protein
MVIKIQDIIFHENPYAVKVAFLNAEGQTDGYDKAKIRFLQMLCDRI